MHCGQCPELPCDQLYTYSYLDAEHGDRPPGTRIGKLNQWASDEGLPRKLLLSSAGFASPDGAKNEEIEKCFLTLLERPPQEAKVLFIPAAAVSDEAKHYARACLEELLGVGIPVNHVFVYNLDRPMSADEALSYDVIYFTGGSTKHLLTLIKQWRFDEVVRRMVNAGKLYVGVSVGSIIATPNISRTLVDQKIKGLALVNAWLDVHCEQPGMSMKEGLPYYHLSDRQALVVTRTACSVLG